jgi:hypothetical protein
VESDQRLRPFLTIVLTGFRKLDEYRQPKGSPLVGLSQIHWLRPLLDQDINEMARQRLWGLIHIDVTTLLPIIRDQGGGHPAVTQRLLSDNVGWQQMDETFDMDRVLRNVLVNSHREFGTCWDGPLTPNERPVYMILEEIGNGDRFDICKQAKLNDMQVHSCLLVLQGCCIVKSANDKNFALGSTFSNLGWST